MFNGAHIISDVANLAEAMKFPYTAKLSEIYDTVFQAFCAKVSISASDVRLLLCKDFTYAIIRSFTENEMEKVITTKCKRSALILYENTEACPLLIYLFK